MFFFFNKLLFWCYFINLSKYYIHLPGSVAGSVALISGSVGKTLATLSFDDHYKRVNNTLVIDVMHIVVSAIWLCYIQSNGVADFCIY